jgi:hypothetical protein
VKDYEVLEAERDDDDGRDANADDGVEREEEVVFARAGITAGYFVQRVLRVVFQ